MPTIPIPAVFAFLAHRGWVADLASPDQVSFLAAGEYNENFLIDTPSGRCVFRVNHGSQLGLGDGQIAYEHAVLDALRNSGVTPVPYHVEPPGRIGLGEKDAPSAPGRGALLMEYLPGGPLVYERDALAAARLFARVHAQPVPAPGTSPLIIQADPIRDIAEESAGLIARHADHPRTDDRKRLEAYHERILRLADETRALFAADPLVIVNTEVNSGNFLCEETSEADSAERVVRLVDWEKAVISSRYQDLGHFLVPTTTLWKTDFRFDDAGRRAFIAEYVAAAGLDMSVDDALHLAGLLEKTILLRALSWCYMAWYEYTQSDRALRHDDTFAVISRYLDEIACFLK